MKHAAQRKASPVKPKTETLIQATVVEKTPSAAKKISGKADLKTTRQNSAANNEPGNGQTASEISAKNTEILPPIISADQPKSAVEKSKNALTAAATEKSVDKKTRKTPLPKVAANPATRKPEKFEKAAIGDFEEPKKSAAKNKPADPVEQIAADDKLIETAEPKRAAKPRNKKAKPISSAIFRGKKARYEFSVFALDELFEPIPAVYIISRRKTDKSKRSHHALICIGETTSIFDELKRHQKGKCVKNHRANVVSILPEADEKIRLKIETDLKAAHSVACGLD